MTVGLALLASASPQPHDAAVVAHRDAIAVRRSASSAWHARAIEFGRHWDIDPGADSLVFGLENRFCVITPEAVATTEHPQRIAGRVSLRGPRTGHSGKRQRLGEQTLCRLSCSGRVEARRWTLRLG
jgi:hypothetical protein